MKYRDKTEIIQDILQTARSNENGAVKTQLMYKAFLSYTQVKEYLTLLIERDLIRYDSITQETTMLLFVIWTA